jgi:NADH:ubiquinone oxidoreductase subunit 4 (subunit M)
MIHAGVLMKLGAYAAMRVGIQMLPDGAVYWMPFVISAHHYQRRLRIASSPCASET